MLGANTILGVNGFYDSSRLFNKWYPSGGVGLEMAANVAGDDAIDLNFNWYGNLFNRDVLVNAFRNKGNSFDVEAGYSHALFNRSLDLRLKLVGYQFDIGTAVQGWRGGADLTTRDGMFTVRYEHGHDRINGDYNTVGGFVTVGFQLENLLNGESPVVMPEPVFKSPRDLRRLLGLKVKRNWHQPEAVVLARALANPTPPPPPPSCTNLQGVVFQVSSLPTCTPVPTPQPIPTVTTLNARICWCQLQENVTTGLAFADQTGAEHVALFSFFMSAGTGCTEIQLYPAAGGLPPNFIDFEAGFTCTPPALTFGPGGGISIQVNQ